MIILILIANGKDGSDLREQHLHPGSFANGRSRVPYPKAAWGARKTCSECWQHVILLGLGLPLYIATLASISIAMLSTLTM